MTIESIIISRVIPSLSQICNKFSANHDYSRFTRSKDSTRLNPSSRNRNDEISPIEVSKEDRINTKGCDNLESLDEPSRFVEPF